MRSTKQFSAYRSTSFRWSISHKELVIARDYTDIGPQAGHRAVGLSSLTIWEVVKREMNR